MATKRKSNVSSALPTPAVAPKAAPTQYDAQLAPIFADPANLNAAKGALNYWDAIMTPEVQAGQMYNMAMPTTANDPVMAQLEGLATAPIDARSPEVLKALSLLEQDATRTNYNTPEMMQAYQNAMALAMGDATNPMVIAQRDALNQQLDSAMQTGLSAARVQGLSRGQMGGVQGALQRPVIRDYLNSYQQGVTQQQLGNMDRYMNAANQVDQNQFGRRTAAIGAFNKGIGDRETFEQQRANDRLTNYNTYRQGQMANYYQFGEADRTRRDNYLAGRMQAPFLGASTSEAYLGRVNSDRYNQQSIAAMRGSGRSSSGGSRTPSFGTQAPATEAFPTPK